MSRPLGNLIDRIVDNKVPLKKYAIKYFQERRLPPQEEPYLTKRERDVLPMMGMPTRWIAERLGVSVKTIEKYECSLRDKFKVTSKVLVVVKSIKWGLVSIDELVLEETKK